MTRIFTEEWKKKLSIAIKNNTERDKKKNEFLIKSGYELIILNSEEIMKCDNLNNILDINLLK